MWSICVLKLINGGFEEDILMEDIVTFMVIWWRYTDVDKPVFISLQWLVRTHLAWNDHESYICWVLYNSFNCLLLYCNVTRFINALYSITQDCKGAYVTYLHPLICNSTPCVMLSLTFVNCILILCMVLPFALPVWHIDYCVSATLVLFVCFVHCL